ncbi:hypothetical protein [Lysobacter enzymogenes]|uniref:hypothetical protein n=1 Tax=Lysobacter enzymogenes TaxID=69 RepID=UPI001A97A6BB|nr:hypothetical protein [Lysobacter enzymogenes]QQP94887.1 hypothetical protein JHW38_16745 [Lysobacter enzymogenes]
MDVSLSSGKARGAKPRFERKTRAASGAGDAFRAAGAAPEFPHRAGPIGAYQHPCTVAADGNPMVSRSASDFAGNDSRIVGRIDRAAAASMTSTRISLVSPALATGRSALAGGVRALWFMAAAVALPAWAHWETVIGETDVAVLTTMTPVRFLTALTLFATVCLLLTVLPCALLLRWRQRRRGPRRYDRALAAAAIGAALLLALHTNLTVFALHYGNTWARWEPTLELFLPWWPAISACVAAMVALEMRWPRGR